MLLAIDCGNTNTVFALCDADKILYSWRCKTDAARTADEYAAFLSPLLPYEINQLDKADIIISSVVPAANFNLERLCVQYFQAKPLFIRYGETDFGLEVRLDQPEEAGADRLVNAVAVKAHYQTPAIVIDFGTATNFDCISKDGAHIGGALAPGINLSLNALHHAAAKLPKVSIRQPPRAIGTNTVHAMQSGIYWGYVEMISGMVKRLSDEMDGTPFVLATGGLAHTFQKDIPAIQLIDDDLTLKGLLEIWKRMK
jgi:type III pantothenate kinase